MIFRFLSLAIASIGLYGLLLFGSQNAKADATYVWHQSAPGAMPDSSGQLTISDVAFAAGQAQGIGCGMSCGPDLSNQLLSLTFIVDGGSLIIVPPVSSALYNYSLTTLPDGLLIGSIYAESYSARLTMNSSDGVWSIGTFASDNMASGCFFSPCGGVKGYWLDARFPTPVSIPGTLALLALPLGALAMRYTTQRRICSF